MSSSGMEGRTIAALEQLLTHQQRQRKVNEGGGRIREGGMVRKS